MSRDIRKDYYNRDRESHEQSWDRENHSRYHNNQRGRKRSRSRSRSWERSEKRRSRSPRKHNKDVLDDKVVNETPKLPEPNELWDNNRFRDGFIAPPPPPTFSRETSGPYRPSYQQPYSGIYDDFPPMAPAPPVPPHPPEIASWNQMSLPPPASTLQPYNIEDQIKKEAAIESEMRHQKAALSKQREDYIKKASILKKELDTLRDQRTELRGDSKRSPSPDTKRFLKENTKLQLEIQNKLKTIMNVVDMLNGIIGEEAADIPQIDDLDKPKRKSRTCG